MPTVIDLVDYIIALKQELVKKEQIIQSQLEQLKELNKAKK